MSSLQFVYPVVAVACDDLTDGELLALSLAVQLGNDPRGVKGYEKASSLFTANGGTQMHSETKEAFLLVVQERLL